MITARQLSEAREDQRKVWRQMHVHESDIGVLLAEFDDLLTGTFDVDKAYSEEASERPGRWYYHLEEDALYRFMQLSPMEVKKRVPETERQSPTGYQPYSKAPKFWGWERASTNVSRDIAKPLLHAYYEDYHDNM